MSKKEKREREVYELAKQEYLHQLRSAQAESIKQFDTQILYISSGALLLSVSFIGDVVKLEDAIWTGVLIFAWILLTATVVLSVLSHLSSYQQHEKAIKKIEDEEEPLDDKLNRNLNRWIAGIFLTGIISLILFAIINIKHMKPKMTQEMKIKSIDTTAINPAVKSIEKYGNPVLSAPKVLNKQSDSTKSKK